MSALEAQLQASIDIIELRKRDSATLAAVIKAAQAELAARKAKLRSDVAELAKQKKALQRTAAELSSAGYRVRARVARKDKGTKRSPKLRAGLFEMSLVSDADAINNAAEAAEREDEQRRDDFERQQAGRNEP
jgi:hypothetical protein